MSLTWPAMKRACEEILPTRKVVLAARGAPTIFSPTIFHDAHVALAPVPISAVENHFNERVVR